MAKARALTVSVSQSLPSTSALAKIAAIPEEEVWLSMQKSARTRRAYAQDIKHFLSTLRITSSEDFRELDHRAVTVWERTDA